MASVEKWMASNGNMCFKLTERNVLKWLRIIIVTTIIALVICGVEIYVFKSCFLLVPILIILSLFFVRWIFVPEKRYATIMAHTVHEIMDDVVNEDAKALNLIVLKSKVEYDCKGTYGIIEACYLLVLL